MANKGGMSWWEPDKLMVSSSLHLHLPPLPPVLNHQHSDHHQNHYQHPNREFADGDDKLTLSTYKYLPKIAIFWGAKNGSASANIGAWPSLVQVLMGFGDNRRSVWKSGISDQGTDFFHDLPLSNTCSQEKGPLSVHTMEKSWANATSVAVCIVSDRQLKWKMRNEDEQSNVSDQGTDIFHDWASSHLHTGEKPLTHWRKVKQMRPVWLSASSRADSWNGRWGWAMSIEQSGVSNQGTDIFHNLPPSDT